MGAERTFASRAGTKLAAALAEFEIDVAGAACADFGCHAGGFTDCLLRRGAAVVYAVDTGYGTLDYRLRTDPRVVVMERTNVLHCDVPRLVDLVTVDLGWTRQRHAVPAALRWLAPGGRVITLVQPHSDAGRAALAAQEATQVMDAVVRAFPDLGAEVLAMMESPLRGAKSARGHRREGNREYLVLIAKRPSGIR